MTNDELNTALAEALGVDTRGTPEEALRQTSYLVYTNDLLWSEWCRANISEVSIFEWAWSNRHGKPWQAELESAVAAYRKPPPNYVSWHGMGLLLEAVKERCSISIGQDPSNWFVAAYSHGADSTATSRAPFLPRAVAEAVLAAVTASRTNAPGKGTT